MQNNKPYLLLLLSVLSASCELLSRVDPTEESGLQCSDGLDNDADGAADCADTACTTNAACIETNCTDDIDNDNDTFIDCEDTDCAPVPECQGPRCGDGSINQANEECDLKDLGGQACGDFKLPPGQLQCNAECRFDTSGCVVAASCNNGIVEPGEECDGGNFNGQDCTNFGLNNGFLKCDPTTCQIDSANCLPAGPQCNNGIIEGNERCDKNDTGGVTCTDLGFGGGVLICKGDCQNFDPTGCTPLPAICNNGVAEGTEACDLGDLRGNSCASFGLGGGALLCKGDCGGFDTSGCQGVCPDADGDGFPSSQCGGPDCNDALPNVNPAQQEQCDGLDNDCDGQFDVSNFNFPGSNFSFPDVDQDGFGGGTLVFFTCPGVFGFVPNNFDCNDADNTINPNAADVCDFVDTNCDNVLEFCSDGNTTPGDGCNSFCNPESCGDGIPNNNGEECDNGAANSDTIPGACRTDCTLPACSDGVVDPGQVCFQSSSQIFTGDSPRGFAINDFDNDGDPDIAFITTDTVVAFLNDGAGAFPTGFTVFAASATPYVSISSADYDGIFGPDVAVGTSNEVHVLLKGSNTTFDVDNTLSVGANVLASVNIDPVVGNDIDLLVGLSGVTTFINTGESSGIFNNIGSTDVIHTPSAIATGDFNGDDRIDYVTTTQFDDTGTVFLNADGLGSVNVQALDTGVTPFAIAPADFDGDQDLDLVVSNRFVNQGRILFNDGFGNFTFGGFFDLFNDATAIAPIDIDQDGLLDLVYGGFNSGAISVSLNTTIGFSLPVSLSSPGGASGLVVTDLNGDGIEDIIAANNNLDFIIIHFATP